MYKNFHQYVIYIIIIQWSLLLTHTTVIHKTFDQLSSKSCWPETDSRDLMIRLDIFVPGKKIGD